MNIFNNVIRYDKNGKCITPKYKGDNSFEVSKKKKEKEEYLPSPHYH